MYNKYIILGIIFILIAVNASSSLSLKICKDNSVENIHYNENIDVCFGEIKDGRGLTVEICNNGDVDVENIQLNIEVESGKRIFIPKKIYEIPFLAASDSTEFFINIFGFNLGRLFGYPMITLTLSSSAVDLTWKRIGASVFGAHTNILEEYSVNDEPFEGYTLFAPMWDTKTYLINNKGNVVYTWNSVYTDSQAIYLLENGNLVRTSLASSPIFAGGAQGRIEMFDTKGNKIWNYEYSSDQFNHHHDVEILPNGNILLVAWELKTKAEAVDAGKNPNRLNGNEFWPDHVIEVEPIGDSGANIVWEWHVWEHLIQDYDPAKANYDNVSAHPELIDINFGGNRADWNHINSIDYNEKFNQILLSVHEFDEIWVIDHSTTIEEAAGHSGGKYGKGGDLLYRWGNPQAYKQGTEDDKKYFRQHDGRWVEEGCPGEGNILVFNNGEGRPGGRYSSVDEIIPPVDENGFYEYTPGTAYGPEEQIWIYTMPNPSDMFSMMCGSSQRLPNGNTLICSASQGFFLEVTEENEIVWRYDNPYPFLIPQKSVAEALRYPNDYPGIPEVKSINKN